MKGLRRNILDIDLIQTGNPKTLVFVDASDYIGEPERPLLEVTLPGHSKYFLVNFVARKVNTFNSNTLGLTELLNNDCLVDLPDGVYSVRFKICPYNTALIDKVFFRTTLIEISLGELYDRIDASDCYVKEDKEIKSAIVEIHTLIEGAKLVVQHNIKKANQFYSLASKLLQKTLDKIDKKCK